MVHINFNPSAGWSVSFLNESSLASSFTGTRILIIAAIAFAFLALCYTGRCYCYKSEVTITPRKNPDPDANKIKDVKKEVLTQPNADLKPKKEIKTDLYEPVTKSEIKKDPLHREQKKIERDVLASLDDLESKSESLKDPLDLAGSPSDIKPVVPKKDVPSLEDIKLSELKYQIRHELKENDLNGNKLKELIEEYSKLSLYKPLEYLPTAEEILKTFATKLHMAIDSKEKWMKLSLVINDILWMMVEYNPFEGPEYKAVHDRVLKLQTELMKVDVSMKRLYSDWESAQQTHKIGMNETQAILSMGPGDDGKRMMLEQQQKYKAKLEKKQNELKEQAETIRKKLKDLSEL